MSCGAVMLERNSPVLALLTAEDMTKWRNDVMRERDKLNEVSEWLAQEIMKRHQRPHAEIIAEAGARAKAMYYAGENRAKQPAALDWDQERRDRRRPAPTWFKAASKDIGHSPTELLQIYRGYADAAIQRGNRRPTRLRADLEAWLEINPQPDGEPRQVASSPEGGQS